MDIAASGYSKLRNALFARRLQELEGRNGVSAWSLHAGDFIAPILHVTAF